MTPLPQFRWKQYKPTNERNRIHSKLQQLYKGEDGTHVWVLLESVGIDAPDEVEAAIPPKQKRAYRKKATV